MYFGYTQRRSLSTGQRIPRAVRLDVNIFIRAMFKLMPSWRLEWTAVESSKRAPPAPRNLNHSPSTRQRQQRARMLWSKSSRGHRKPLWFLRRLSARHFCASLLARRPSRLVSRAAGYFRLDLPTLKPCVNHTKVRSSHRFTGRSLLHFLSCRVPALNWSAVGSTLQPSVAI